MTDHPLTESRVEKMWNANCLTSFWTNLSISNKMETAAAMRTSYSAGREDAPAQAPAELSAQTILGVPDTYGTPHHDTDAIKAGDFVVEVDKGGAVSGGYAHYQDGDGDWCDENGHNVTWAAVRADRPDAVTVWPAPAPPAEEVELPTEHPAHLLDVKSKGLVKCAYMALDREGLWVGVDTDGDLRSWDSRWIVACTLEGTRVRRDGEREDGTPRFVEVEDV